MDNSEFSCLDYLFEPVVVIDENRFVVYFNHYFSAFSRYSPRILKKREDFSNFFFNSSIDISSFLKKAMSREDPSGTEEIQISFKDLLATYDVVIKVVPLKSKKQKCFLISFHDLSVEKKLYDKYRNQTEEIKKNHTQIVKADKLASIGELTASITNDLNNPLAIASGNCELMNAYFSEKDLNKVKESLVKCNKELQAALARINEIILNMKNFLNRDEDKKEYCHLKDIINEASDMVDQSFKKAGCAIKKDFSDENIASFVHRVKMEQIIVNLLENALYAMQDAKQQKGEVIIRLYQDKEEHAIIEVEDNGPGIPLEMRDKVFNTFFSTKKSEGGSGLGLAISTKIIDAHRGTLKLEKKESRGALFRICLPILELGGFLQHQNLGNPLDFSDDKKEGKKILVLESDIKALNVLTEFLEDTGHVSIGSVNGVNALKILKSLDVDLIITGYDMPKINGSLFTQKVREIGITCPVLYLANEDYRDKYEEDKDKYQVAGLILKPFDRDDILRIIKSIFKD
ncbi:MAG: ATP-binding protein [Halobacteriovoraceae bacterium]|nr:ATP-binding protein [Halobacteriovoraceae bacterium]